MNKSGLTVFIGLLILASCSSNKADQKNIAEAIDTQTVLSIGKVNISAYEFEKNKKQANVQPDIKTIPGLPGGWKNNFIDKIYFLADAYDKGYDKNAHIDSLVEGAARFMVSQSNGLLEQKIHEENKINNNDLQKAVDRSTKEIHIEYLKFKDKNTALKYLQGNPSNTANSFKSLIDKANFLDVVYSKDVLTWPFKGYWGKEEEIFALKGNEVSSLLELYNGYYLIHIERINELPNPIVNKDQMKVQLELAEREKIKQLLHSKIYSQARPVIEHKTMSAFSQRLNNYTYGPNHTFIKTNFKDILPTTILTYISPLGQTKIITVNDFIDFYNTLFIKEGIRTIDDIARNLNAIYFSDYAYTEGVKKGITAQPKFILDRNNYKNNVIYNLYSEQELADRSAIASSEIIQTYNLMKPNLTQAESIVASIYYFNNSSEAIRKKFNILSDTLTFKGLTKVDKHIVINYKSKALPDTLKKLAFELDVKNNPVRIIEFNNQYIVIIKENETGNRVRSLAEVKDMVIAQIKSNRLIENKKARLAELKNKYKPKIDLTNQFNSAIAAN